MPTLTIQIDDATAARLEALAAAQGETQEKVAADVLRDASVPSADQRAAMMEDMREFMTSHAADFRRLAS